MKIKEPKNRVLIKDKNGKCRKILQIFTQRRSSELYFSIAETFVNIVNTSSGPYKEIYLPVKKTKGVQITNVHISYHKDGNCRITADNAGRKAVDKTNFVKHEPLNELTPGKRILSIIPKAAESYPLYKGHDKEYTWQIESEVVPRFFDNVPIQLNFWVGTGLEAELSGKIKSIRNIEMMETHRYVEVYGGQENQIQIFMTISRPKQLTSFPSEMRIWLHPSTSAALRRVRAKEK